MGMMQHVSATLFLSLGHLSPCMHACSPRSAIYYMGHFHKKGQITVKTWRSIFNPIPTRYLCISIDISMPFDTYVLEKIINAYNLYYY